MKETFGSGTNIVKGVEKFYNVVDKSGVLKNKEKKNENNNIEEVKTNLFKKATENKNKEKSNEDIDKDSKIISYDFKGINPSKDIFNYNPQANVGFDLGKKGEGFFATGDVDASRRGVNTNFEAGFKNENVDIGFKPEKGITLDLQKQFGNNTNLNINQSGFNVGTKFGENTNVNVNQSGPSLTTKFKETNIAVNPDRFNLNRTFEIGDDTRINVGGEVDFDGESKGKIDFTKDFLNKKVQIYGGADTKGDFEVGTKFKFLNL